LSFLIVCRISTNFDLLAFCADLVSYESSKPLSCRSCSSRIPHRLRNTGQYSCTPPFFRAKLSIEFDEYKRQSDYAPSSESRNHTQRYLRVYVRNKGHRSVHNCQAELAVVVPDNTNPICYPSDERKLLAWGRFPQADDITDARTIRSHNRDKAALFRLYGSYLMTVRSSSCSQSSLSK
jgi:hypothetical protein